MNTTTETHRPVSRIRTPYGDMIGYVTKTDDGEFYQVASASGMVPKDWDTFPLTPGESIFLSYNYDDEEYTPSDVSWGCDIVRINGKSVTVRSHTSGVNHRIKL